LIDRKLTHGYHSESNDPPDQRVLKRTANSQSKSAITLRISIYGSHREKKPALIILTPKKKSTAEEGNISMHFQANLTTPKLIELPQSLQYHSVQTLNCYLDTGKHIRNPLWKRSINIPCSMITNLAVFLDTGKRIQRCSNSLETLTNIHKFDHWFNKHSPLLLVS